ncbi:MAG: ATP-binding protein [Clostridia bacterium]|nr:ATP-binding protein [Clostridia bacterium]
MGYNQEAFETVRERYQYKFAAARQQAEEHEAEVCAQIPEMRNVLRRLRNTGPELFALTLSGKKAGPEEIAKIRKDKEEALKRRSELLRAAGYPEDYLDVHYECPKCGDSGYIGIQMCDCMKREIILESYKYSGIGELLKTQTFDTFKLEYYRGSDETYKLMSANLDYIRRYADRFDEEGGNMLFMGATGLGKTHLCSALARQLIDTGHDVLYVSAINMLADFEKQRFGGTAPEAENDGVDRYYGADLLIIDDLGTEIANQFTLSVLYGVINGRMNRKQATIINTNLTNRELQARYTDRIVSRLLGEYAVILFKGTDVRMQKIRK